MENLLLNLKAVLITTPQRFNQLTQSIPENLLRQKPLAGEWSALDVLQHLIDVEQGVFPVRLKAMLAGADSFPAYDPETEGSAPPADASPAGMAAHFATLRAENLKIVDTLSPADLERTAIHSELGRVSMSELLHEWGAHDLMHTVQAEQALMQPFIEGCKPWAGYFTKHVAGA
jgi:hypothetical protein